MAKSPKNNKATEVLQTPDLAKKGLKGNVWQVKQNFYKVRVKKNGVMNCTLYGKKYDEHNIIITFNEQGKRLSELRYGVVGEADNHIYNEDGKLIEYISYDKDGNKKSTSKRTYDKWGYLHTSENYDINNNLTNTTVWIADEKGGFIDFYTLMPDGAKHGRQTFINDNNGQKTDQKIWKNDGTLDRWIQYKNNEQGHSTETKELNPDGTVKSIETRTYEYDGNGRIIGSNGEIYRRDETELETYKFEYDERDNWIRKYQYYRDIPTGILIREINYFGDNKEALSHKTTLKIKKLFILESTDTNIGEVKEADDNKDYEDDDDHEPEENKMEITLTPAQLQWVMEAGTLDVFNAYRYYGVLFNEIPVKVTIDNDIVEVMALMHKLKKEMGACVVNCSDDGYGHYNHPTYSDYVLCFPDKPYILYVDNIAKEDLEDYDIPYFIENRIDMSYQKVNTGEIVLMRPSDASGKRDMEWEQEFDYHLQTCMIKQKPEMPQIYMIQVQGTGFSLKAHPVNDNFLINDLDLNYGYGFEKFHDELMERFKTGTKGLVLFHGQPGTGKTFYIRHLLRKMASNNKKVIYMPPNMVDHLTDPGFLTFLASQVGHFSTNGNFCVLLIEDAEPLLAKRQEGVRIQGVTNLLNMTDGLLNDMLNLQIICTFNVDLKRLDSALLRPGRLIARKEFKALAVLDANLLAQRLGIKHQFRKSASLGEIYSMLKNNNTLIHDVEPDKDASSAIDDL